MTLRSLPSFSRHSSNWRGTHSSTHPSVPACCVSSCNGWGTHEDVLSGLPHRVHVTCLYWGLAHARYSVNICLHSTPRESLGHLTQPCLCFSVFMILVLDPLHTGVATLMLAMVHNSLFCGVCVWCVWGGGGPEIDVSCPPRSST